MDDTRKTKHAEAILRQPAVGVVVLFSPESRLVGSEHELGDGLAIGRAGGAGLDLPVNDPEMSRRHARIVVEEGLFVEDLGSTNGTVVNGSAVTRARVAPGDVLRVGGTLLEVAELPPVAPEPLSGEPALVGRSPAFRAAVRAIDRAAGSRIPVLIVGETGTGKELFASRLHALSGRTGPFVAVNSAAIPRELLESTMFGHRRGAFTGALQDAVGYFTQANGGTLFLDEIGEMPPELQPKLLRALETGEFTPVGRAGAETSDVRVVAATNADLLRKIEAGTFRRDLYARLAGYVVELPPLRQRRGDVVALTEHFLGGKQRLTASFLEPLLLAPWPMNVRELRMVVQRIELLAAGDEPLTSVHSQAALGAVNAAAALRLERLPPPEPEEPPAPEEEAEEEEPLARIPPREEMEALLLKLEGNVKQLAIHYGRHRKQIYRWLKRHGLDAERFRQK
jgi:two-component system response regulator HydG